jgi:hypothetical protein
MRSTLKGLSRRHSTAVAYLALFAALGGSAYAAVTVTGKNIKDGTITGKDVKNRSLGTKKLSATAVSSLTGQRGPAGSQGPKGDPGEQGPQGPKGDPGLNVAGTRQVPNQYDIACNQDVVVGTLPVSVPSSSRIWTDAHGPIANMNSGATEAGLWLRLRDAGDTKTLAVSVASFEGELEARTVSPLQTGGLMLAGSNPTAPANAYTAAPGSYLLQLVVRSQGGTCGQTQKPSFGWNQGGAMGFELVGP